MFVSERPTAGRKEITAEKRRPKKDSTNIKPGQRRALKTSATQCPQRPRAALKRSPLELKMSISA